MSTKETKKKTSTKKKTTKAAAPKKAAKKKPSGPTKAAMASALKDKGIPLPKSADMKDMEHRLRHWKSGMGYMVRVHRNAGKKYANHPLTLLNKPRKTLYWLPDSEMTERILKTRRVVVVGRVTEPSNNMVVIDVPSDYDTRF